MTRTIHAELVTYRHGCWGYINYVFKNLDNPQADYIYCTRFPNWDCADLQIGDVGFLKCKEVVAGDSKWYDWRTDKYIPYKYSGIHFLDFVYEKPKEDITMTLIFKYL